MLNPPPVLTVVLPFGALPFRAAATAWLALLGVLLAWCGSLLWKLSGGDERRLWWVLACCLWFPPTLILLLLGQISLLPLLGIALFLRFTGEGRAGAAGAASTLLLVKPHLLYLVGIGLIGWWLRTRDRRFLVGALIGAAAGAAVPLVFNPSIYAQYLELARAGPVTQYSTSTLGAVLRLASGNVDRFWLQFVPVVPGLLYVTARLRRGGSGRWQWEREMPALVVVSVATAAYGWVFDQVVLLAAALPMFACAIRTGGRRLAGMIAFWAAICTLAFALAVRDVNYFWYFWIPPAFVLAMLGFNWDVRFAPPNGRGVGGRPEGGG